MINICKNMDFIKGITVHVEPYLNEIKKSWKLKSIKIQESNFLGLLYLYRILYI